MNVAQRALLKLLRRRRKGYTLTALIAELGRSRSSLYGRLRVLEATGYVEVTRIDKAGPPGWEWLWFITETGRTALKAT